MSAEAITPSTRHSQVATTATVIPVTITNPTDPDFVGVQLADTQRYLSVVENFDDTLTWELDTSNAAGAFFDRPGLIFINSPGPVEIVREDTRLSVDWSNVNPATRGMSFSYRLQVVVPIDGVLIPVVHDPTVHNEPPTI